MTYPKIERKDFSCLQLDAKNPRLGHQFIQSQPSQEAILKRMKDWTLEELGGSFVQSGFWPQEALIVLEKDDQLTVLEGNRRLAALQLLHQAAQGDSSSVKWKKIAADATPQKVEELRFVPCMKVTDRREIQAYLGFRHVTGIKQWAPAEKASYIAHLIKKENLSYQEVMRCIGSKTPTVRQHYIAYRLLIQIEEEVSDISMENLEERFSVMYLSIRSTGTQSFLKIDMTAETPSKNFRPVPKSKLEALTNFAQWLFGTETKKPLFSDSRDTDTFGRILGNEKSLAYLERTPNPSFKVAARLSGSEETAVLENIEKATDEVEEALSVMHLHKNSRRLCNAMDRFGRGAITLIEMFPDLYDRIIKESR